MNNHSIQVLEAAQNYERAYLARNALLNEHKELTSKALKVSELLRSANTELERHRQALLDAAGNSSEIRRPPDPFD